MKNLYNAVLALLLTGTMVNVCANDEVIASLQQALDVLQGDTRLYVQLQEEVDKISQEFDTSAEMRRRLQCCVTYKFDSMKQSYAHRENELLTVIADKDATIAELEERFDIFKAQAAAELEFLSNMVDILTQELNVYRTRDSIEVEIMMQDIFDLFASVQAQYAAMQDQRTNFLTMLEELSNKVYAHFEIEAIESNAFGEQICGTLYCPELDEDEVPEQAQDDAVADAVNPADATGQDAFASYVAYWDEQVVQ